MAGADEVVGVDIDPRPLERNPGPTIAADMFTLDPEFLRSFDLIHASPPCQRYSVSTHNARKHLHPDLIAATRTMLDAVGLPYVIENVPGAPIRGDLMLCGTMFDLATPDGLVLRRHRYFELGGWTTDALGPVCQHRRGRTITVTGDNTPSGNIRTLGRATTLAERRIVMGMPWASQRGLAEAIPPAYTDHIGRLFQAWAQGPLAPAW